VSREERGGWDPHRSGRGGNGVRRAVVRGSWVVKKMSHRYTQTTSTTRLGNQSWRRDVKCTHTPPGSGKWVSAWTENRTTTIDDWYGASMSKRTACACIQERRGRMPTGGRYREDTPCLQVDRVTDCPPRKARRVVWVEIQYEHTHR
jgi:hypothetical protein